MTQRAGWLNVCLVLKTALFHLAYQSNWVHIKVKIERSTRATSEMAPKAADHHNFFAFPLTSPGVPYVSGTDTNAPGEVVGPSVGIRGAPGDVGNAADCRGCLVRKFLRISIKIPVRT